MTLPHLMTIDIEGIEIFQRLSGHATVIKVVRNPIRFSAYISNLIDNQKYSYVLSKASCELSPFELKAYSVIAGNSEA
jgi:hypothetical protein